MRMFSVNFNETSLPYFAKPRSYDLLFNMVSLLLIGAIGFASNIFILFVIQKYKELRSPCFLLIAANCVCSLSIALGHFIIGAEDLLFYFRQISEYRVRTFCYLTNSVLPNWGIQGASIMTTLIGLDRTISILKPLKYRLLARRYVYLAIVCCYLYATAAVLGGFFSTQPSKGMWDLIECPNMFSPFTHRYLDYYGWFNFVLSLICILLYAGMLVAFSWRRRRMADSKNQCQTHFLKKQMACMPAIKLLLAVYVLTSVVPEFMIAIITSYESLMVYLVRIYYYGSFLKASSSLAEIFALSLGSSQFRQCVKKMIAARSGGGHGQDGGGGGGGVLTRSSMTASKASSIM